MDYPTRASVELGMRLTADPDARQAIVEFLPEKAEHIEEARRQEETFSIPQFMGLVRAMHGHMHHGPFACPCETQTVLLGSLMAKMFYAGWSAGRQEVMDEAVGKLVGDARQDAGGPEGQS